MHLTPEQVAVLMKPLNPARVTRRSQGGAQLSYLEAWDVKATLIRVFGFGGFSAECIETNLVGLVQDTEGRKNWTATAVCTVRLTIPCATCGQSAVYTESAASSQTNPQPGEAADFAIKTAESDALKRAAIYLGTQFGLSLYAGVTTDVVKKVFAPGQRDEDVKPAAENLGDVPGAPAEQRTADQKAQAQEFIDRATQIKGK